MAMNREQKRLLQKQGAINADGTPSTAARKSAAPPVSKAPRPKASEPQPGLLARIRQYFREVVAELRKVTFPTRAETVQYSVIIFIVLIVFIAVVGVLDFALSHFVLKVYSQ